MIDWIKQHEDGESVRQKLNSLRNDLDFLIASGLTSTSENFRITDHVYDANNLLQNAIIRIYNNSTDCDSEINPLAEYSMTALYDGTGRLIDYKVIKT